jgi:amidophosphoribosyltransferase
VFGIYAPGEDVATLTYFALFALQHRGQESAGIAVSDGARTVVHREMGLVSQVFGPSDLAALDGHLAVGHCRYSTTGASSWENAQPVYRESGGYTHRARAQRQPREHGRTRQAHRSADRVPTRS